MEAAHAIHTAMQPLALKLLINHCMCVRMCLCVYVCAYMCMCVCACVSNQCGLWRCFEVAAYAPQVEAISPTPEDNSMEERRQEILANVEKVEHEIQRMEGDLNSLKQKEVRGPLSVVRLLSTGRRHASAAEKRMGACARRRFAQLPCSVSWSLLSPSLYPTLRAEKGVRHAPDRGLLICLAPSLRLALPPCAGWLAGAITETSGWTRATDGRRSTRWRRVRAGNADEARRRAGRSAPARRTRAQGDDVRRAHLRREQVRAPSRAVAVGSFIGRFVRATPVGHDNWSSTNFAPLFLWPVI